MVDVRANIAAVTTRTYKPAATNSYTFMNVLDDLISNKKFRNFLPRKGLNYMHEYLKTRVRTRTYQTTVSFSQDGFHTQHLEHVRKLNVTTFPVKYGTAFENHNSMAQLLLQSQHTFVLAL